jgi:hypothetical protein
MGGAIKAGLGFQRFTMRTQNGSAREHAARQKASAE